MPGKPKPALDLSDTLCKVRDPVIHIECLRCGRGAALVRAEIVKKYGANVTFARLRRAAAMGCDRIASEHGDRCETHFPSLMPSRDGDRD